MHKCILVVWRFTPGIPKISQEGKGQQLWGVSCGGKAGVGLLQPQDPSAVQSLMNRGLWEQLANDWHFTPRGLSQWSDRGVAYCRGKVLSLQYFQNDVNDSDILQWAWRKKRDVLSYSIHIHIMWMALTFLFYCWYYHHFRFICSYYFITF